VLNVGVELRASRTEMELDESGSILLNFDGIVATAVLPTVGTDEELSGEHRVPDNERLLGHLRTFPLV